MGGPNWPLRCLDWHFQTPGWHLSSLTNTNNGVQWTGMHPIKCARKYFALFTSVWAHEISNNIQSQWEMESKWIRSKNRWREGDVLWVGAAGAHLARWHLHGSTECANGLIGAEQHRAAESDKSVAQQRRKKKNKCQNTLLPERTQHQNLCTSNFYSGWVTSMVHKITITAWNRFFWTPCFLTFIISTNSCRVGDPF